MPTAPPVPDLAARLRLAVFRLSRTLRRESYTGVTPTLLAALVTIERHGPITAGDLAAHEQVRKPTVTRILGVLVEQGLVERTPDPLDRRIAWVQLTPQGRRLLQRARRRSDEFLARQIRRLEPDELETLQRAATILDRLVEERP